MLEYAARRRSVGWLVSSDGERREMSDFAAFRMLITPIVVPLLFWVGLVGIVVGSMVGVVTADTTGGRLLLLLWLFVGPVCWRIVCELLLVLFHVSRTLVEIRDVAADNSSE
jgi:hypothetical protein